MAALALCAAAAPTSRAADDAAVLVPGDDAPRVASAESVQKNAHSVQKKKKRQRLVKVRKIRPRNGRTFVPLDASVRIRFSRRINPESVSATTVRFRRLLGDDIEWSAEIAKGGKQLILHPGTFLEPGRDYEVQVKFGVVSDDGAPLKREGHAIFFTDSSVPPFQFIRPDQFESVESSLFEGRAAHASTLLDDGRVLVTGGQSDFVRVSDTADMFDPAEEEFRPAASRMLTPRAYHVGVAVEGAAMLIGGWTGTDATATTEIFEPFSGRFLAGPEMSEERDFTDACVLDDGRVLVVGGLSYTGNAASFSVSAEIFDASNLEWRPTRSRPLERRAGHTLTKLDDGRVLITGGLPAGGSSGPVAEIFDPATETFSYTLTPSLGYRQLHSATRLSDGRVLIADGGNGKTELYDPVLDRFFDAGGSSFVRRTRATAIRMPGDKVLLLGGFATVGDQTLILDGMDLYLPNQGGGFGRVVHVDFVLSEPRAGHTATMLSDGRTLIVGGFGASGDDSLSSALLFDAD